MQAVSSRPQGKKMTGYELAPRDGLDDFAWRKIGRTKCARRDEAEQAMIQRIVTPPSGQTRDVCTGVQAEQIA